MENILNLKDRNQAFLKFLLFFVATLILVVTAIYFDFRLPVRENRALQEEVNLQRQLDANQEKFAGKMQEAIVLLDSLDKPGINADQINSQLGGKLSELAILQEKDNTQNGKIDKAIIDKLSELQQRKKQLKELGEKAAKLNDIQTDLTNTRAQLSQANVDLDACRRSSGYK